MFVMKKKIEVTVREMDLCEFEQDLDDLIVYLEGLKEEAEDKEFSSLKIDVNEYYESVTIRLNGDRDETDKEYESRKKREAKAAERKKVKDAKQLEADRKLYEKLKKKFDKVV
jgi:hypothetical protein